jgi:hypothetical protein
MQDERVLDVSGNKDVEGQPVIAWKMHNGKNQQWNVIYVDGADKISDKGINKDFGWYVNRPFYMVSRLPMKRVAEAMGTNMKLKRWNKGRVRQQTCRFDSTTKTIKGEYYKNYSLDI